LKPVVSVKFRINSLGELRNALNFINRE